MTLMSRVREHSYTVVENEAVGDGIWRMVFRAPKLAGSLEPGQFMNFHVPGAKQILRVPLSFASADVESGTVEIVYATVGDATRALTRMAAGESSSVLGPSGNGWVVREGQGRSVVVGGGVGAPPAVAAAGLLAKKGVAFDGVLGAQTASKLWGVYTCGPQVMMRGIASICREAGIKCQVSMERMMSCGFGACNTCNVLMADGTYKSCCMNGPIFDAEEVAW